MIFPRSAIALLSLLSLHAAGAQGAQDDTLRLFYWQAPTIVNPHLSPGTKDLSASRIVYEPLASFDAKGELVPFLAAEIPSFGQRFWANPCHAFFASAIGREAPFSVNGLRIWRPRAFFMPLMSSFV